MFSPRVTLFAALALVSGLACATPTPRDTRTGSATLFFPSLGACGVLNTSQDLVAALPSEVWDSFGTPPNPNDNPICQRSITVSFNGKSVQARVADKCGCGPNNIMLSSGAFSQLANPADQIIRGVTWTI